MVLLSSSNADGVCHVTTVNLDGETNLKTYQSPAETSTSFKDVISLAELNGVVECEQVRVCLCCCCGCFYFCFSTSTSSKDVISLAELNGVVECEQVRDCCCCCSCCCFCHIHLLQGYHIFG